MALMRGDISYLKSENDQIIYPVTHSSALLGSISNKSYDISDTYGGNWDRVINNGYYMDNESNTVPSSRPPSDINSYGNSCLIKVTNSGILIIQETNYPPVSEINNLEISSMSISISYNYYRVGIYNDASGEVTWNQWTRIEYGQSTTIDDGSVDYDYIVTVVTNIDDGSINND